MRTADFNKMRTDVEKHPQKVKVDKTCKSIWIIRFPKRVRTNGYSFLNPSQFSHCCGHINRLMCV